MPQGELLTVGDTLYGRCTDCGKVKKVGGLFGSLHICLDEEEREQLADRRAAKITFDYYLNRAVQSVAEAERIFREQHGV